MKISGNEHDSGRTAPLLPFLLSVTAFGKGASGSFRSAVAKGRDKKSNDYRPRYYERASIVATDAPAADKGRTGMAAIPSCLRVRRPTIGLNVFRLPLSRVPSSSLRPDIRWKIVSSTWRYAQYAEIPRDSDRPSPSFLSRPAFSQTTARRRDNSSRIIAPFS